MDPSGIYLNELESFTDDLTKYDAKLYLGLDDLSIARRAAINTQKETVSLQPHPPPPVYVPDSGLPVDHTQSCNWQPHRAPEYEGPNLAFRSRGVAHNIVQYPTRHYPSHIPYNQTALPHRSVSAALYPVSQASSDTTQRPASSGVVYTSAAIIKKGLAEAPVQRQSNLFIRSTTTYKKPVAVPCRLPVVPLSYYDYVV